MIREDFHIHTNFCDGKNTPREMVEAALEKGFTDLGFSGHGDFGFCEPGFGMSDQILEKYKETIQELREEYKGKIRLYTGIELDCLGPVQKADYAIGSTHCIEKNGEYIEVDYTPEVLEEGVKRLWHGDWYAMTRDYFELEASVYRRTGCTWVGHFDLVAKFNEKGGYFDENCDAYREPALAAMKELNDQGLPFEINTGAMSRGLKSVPYPSAFLLRELKAMGGRILINSDSHSARHIGFGFEQARKIAWDCGFRTRLILAPDGGFREVLL